MSDCRPCAMILTNGYLVWDDIGRVFMAVEQKITVLLFIRQVDLCQKFFINIFDTESCPVSNGSSIIFVSESSALESPTGRTRTSSSAAVTERLSI